ncbi:hypothetical protein LOK49_LG05G02601 [Camellia lanceoleosa]|uniref:Uncharacterized protein n=1 Tax=Camellia lanceoleosa TaxID=1840588 RepID=A0ACC0HU51_9ERIC|nr:hypothetical protein LOK49_LG05G02601 [Camellia lanceoleosa]
MVISDENKNNPTLIKPIKLQEMSSRRFGVEIRPNRGAIASIQQNCLEKTKKPDSKSVQSFRVWEDCPVTDEEHKAPETPGSMSLDQTEAVPDEKEQMEVEMKDIFEEPVMDIDSCDAKNPLAVVDYVHNVYAYYRKIESCSSVSTSYTPQQSDINEKMRAVLIDWLVEVHHKFELRDKMLFLTVNITDRFLAQQGVAQKKLQLVGLVTMLLVCKYEEVLVPVVDDLLFISDKAYTRKEVLEIERLMLNTLQFHMLVPTPYVFMRRYLKICSIQQKLELLSFF